MTLHDQIYAENIRLKKEIHSLQKQIKNYPNGTLICTKNGKYSKWYMSNGDKLCYISKKERGIAEELAVKKYYTSLLEDLLYKQKAITSYLRQYDPNHEKVNHLLSNTSGYNELLTPHFKSFSEEILQWINSSYDHSKNHPEQLIHKCLSGNIVRSKSEAIIDMALFINKIPFRYECALVLGDTIFFPDFTVRHPKTGNLFYWEHFGMMDDPSYSKSTFSKLQLYNSHGLTPSINLITTFETKNNPLDTQVVEKLIQHYFL